MQNYYGNSGGCMRPGNTGRYSRTNGCQNVVSEPSFVSERAGSRRQTDCSETCITIDDMELAMAYVPWQTWQKIMCPEKAFMTGTIFEELNKPFCGTGGYR